MYIDTYKYIYIKCPVCGKVAVIEIDKILTSMPPKYRWHCEHCGEYGFVECSKTNKFEQVNPSEEDIGVYDPQPKVEIDADNDNAKIINGTDVNRDAVPSEDVAGTVILNAPSTSSLRIYSKCEICDEDFDAGPAISTGFSAPLKHICPTCVNKLKKLLDLVK